MSVILATAGYDHKIRFWNAPSGINSRTLRFPDSQVNCLEITPSKQFLAAGGNNIRLFEINDTASSQPVLTLEGHAGTVTSIGFQRDVRYLYSGSEDGTVKIWDLRSPTFSCSFDCKAPVNSVALNPNRPEIISGDQNGSVKIWDLNSSKCINELVPDAYSNDSNSNTPKPSPPQSSSTQSVLSPSQSQHAFPTTNSNSSYATNTNYNHNNLHHKHPSERVSIQAVDISEDGQTCVAANNHADVFLWDSSNSTNFIPLDKIKAHPMGTYLLKAKISPDCRQLVTCSSDRTAKIFDISREGGIRHNSSSSSSNGGGGNGAVPNTSNNSNESSIDNGDTTTTTNRSGGTPTSSTRTTPSPTVPPSIFRPTLTQTLAQHTKWVWDAVFSADSSYLVTASSDHSARLWNLRTGEVVRQYTGHQYAVTCVALNDSST